MAIPLIDKRFYDSIIRFDQSEESRTYYYTIMNTETEWNGHRDTLRNQILRTYSMLFCDDLGAAPGQLANPDDVEATADRLYLSSVDFSPTHWYRMRYHFPVIDEDNYDRFAALVIADLNAGPLRDAAVNGGDTLLVGGPNPLYMTPEERAHQAVRTIVIGGDERDDSCS